MFGLSKPKENAVSTSEKERADNREVRRLAILNWVPSEITRQPEKLKAFEVALTEDVAGHSISFVRHGDFVAVMQTRKGVKTIKAIQLIREWVKNEKGEATFLRPATITLDYGTAPNLNCGGWAKERRSDALEFYAEPDFKGRAYPHYHGQSYLSGMGYYQGLEPRVRIETGLATGAVDDEIQFDGSGVQILVPFGTGDEVFQRLLSTLAQPLQ